jgi:hypothetical protein
MGTGVFFPGVKRQARGVNYPPPSSVEVKERVEIYLYSLPGFHGLLEGKLCFTKYEGRRMVLKSFKENELLQKYTDIRVYLRNVLKSDYKFSRQ